MLVACKGYKQVVDCLGLTCSSTQALMSPLSGLLGNLFHRGALLATGTFLWAVFSLGFGLSHSYAQVSRGSHVSARCCNLLRLC